jgi:E3 ubiquitin-protein ligase SHPRH
MRKHAPSLKVHVYDGWKSLKKGTNVTKEWADFCQEFDVIITTYHVLSSEVSVAKGAISRPRRQAVEYGERSLPKSPLVSVEFWRVIMDEVQLSGGINTVDMVSRIPR